MPIESWIEQICQSQPRAIARAISAVENGNAAGTELLRRLAPHAAKAVKIGITGAPGSGKSTLVDALITALRKVGRTVGVLAVDPSSPLTGGALLGDRVRMQGHTTDPGVFIRSMAARGALGGVAETTRGAAEILSAAGKDFILIETVGVGQAEVSIAGR
jgi:LAO/AO transport system kinase